jgi:hypothetical protein
VVELLLLWFVAFVLRASIFGVLVPDDLVNSVATGVVEEVEAEAAAFFLL